MKKIIMICSLLIACGRGYSDGQRTGTIVKFSKKGIFCKSYEGMLNLGGTSRDGDGNVVPSTWEFNVQDEKLVQQLVDVQEKGGRVTLIYTQWVLSPVCRGSAYEVIGIK